VKSEAMKLEKELEDARTKLAECSYIANLTQWNILFENVKKLSFQSGDINRELAQLERKINLRCLNRFYFVVYF
jgi:hypothetical protein